MEAIETTETGQCDSWASVCFCVEPTGHTEAHRCDCGGSWTGVYGTPTFEVLIHPCGVEKGQPGWGVGLTPEQVEGIPC